MSRHIALEGVDNFRDFGDYPGRGGARLRRGRLYRSASHAHATDADLEAIATLDLAVIVDLRRRNERERNPSRRHHKFSGVVIENPTGEESDDTWRTHITSSDLSVESFREYMFEYYRAAPFEPRHIDLFSRYFAILAEADGPVLIHCAAGKDRTGLLAALTHHVAGVHPSDMAADFLLTNDPAGLEKRLPAVTEVIAEIAGRTPDPTTVLLAMSVEAAYLDVAFAMMAERFGSIDAYLEQALGVDFALRDRLCERLLA